MNDGRIEHRVNIVGSLLAVRGQAPVRCGHASPPRAASPWPLKSSRRYIRGSTIRSSSSIPLPHWTTPELAIHGFAVGPASRDDLPLPSGSAPPCVRSARGSALRPSLPVGGEERERRAACHVHLAARRCRTDMLPTLSSHPLTRSPSHPHPQPRASAHVGARSRPLSGTRSRRSFRRRQRRCAALAPCRPRVVSAHAAAPCPPKSCPVLSA